MTEGCQPANNPLPNPERGSFKASLGHKAERPPFAKWSSRSYDWNFLGEWLFFVPLGSRSDENSSSASGVAPKTYSQSQMTRAEVCFPAASFSQQGAPERTWEAELSLPLMKQSPHAALKVFSLRRGCFSTDFLSSFGAWSEAPLGERVGAAQKVPQAPRSQRAVGGSPWIALDVCAAADDGTVSSGELLSSLVWTKPPEEVREGGAAPEDRGRSLGWC